MSKSRLILVDDHPLVRQYLTGHIQHEADLEVCGEAADPATATALIGSLQPDLVLLDISLKGANGLDLLKELKVSWPNLRVLVVSIHDEAFYAKRALLAGARGYITKEDAIIHLLSAIRRVLNDHVYLSESMVAA